MINRELREEIEMLTAQNLVLSEEIKQLKVMLQKQAEQLKRSNQQNDGGNGGHQQGGQDQNNQNQQKNQNQSSGGFNQDNGGGGQSGGQNMQQNQGQNPIPISKIANDFLQLKGFTSSLENKMNTYLSSQSGGGPLKLEDIAYLILNMMNGMIDWTIEYVARSQSSQSN
jgi:hypothetical protein